eukprot:COSAG05_NODE_8_length_40675_cov_148.837539_45_plen_192_part_00
MHARLASLVWTQPLTSPLPAQVNFRAFTGGLSKIVLNAILQGARRPAAAAEPASASAFARRHAASRANASLAASARRWPSEDAPGKTVGGSHRSYDRNRNATELAIDWTRNVKLSVPRKSGEVTLATLQGQLARALRALGGQPPRLVRASAAQYVFLIPNPGALDVEEHPWFGQLAQTLPKFGVQGAHLLF